MKPVPIPRFKTVYAQYSCPIKNAASLIGDKWILFIIREFLYGKEKQGFLELQRYLKPISSRTLAKKLKSMEQQGIIFKKILRKSPPRVEYTLTPKGKALQEVLKGLAAWYKHQA